MTVTVADRFAAHEWIRAARIKGEVTDALIAVRKATYAESFPTGYTAETVEASKRLLSIFSIVDDEERDALFAVEVANVLAALAAGRYGEGLR